MGAPRVKTPNVVDFPLSTLPTTAHRTSGVEATSGGGNRNSNAALGWSVLLSNSIDVFCARKGTLRELNVERYTE